MNELIKITTNENGQRLVSARELHEFMEVTERFQQWFNKRVEKYDFIENEDYVGCKFFHTLAKQELQDYGMTIDMSKEMSMLQNNEKGKQARKYFIKCEKQLKEIQSKANLLLQIYEGGQSAILASKQLTEIEVQEATQPLIGIIEEQKPKAKFAEQIEFSKTAIGFKQFSDLLNIKNFGRNTMMNWFRNQNYINPNNEPYRRYIEQGLFDTKEKIFNTPYGEKITITTLITGKGQIYFQNKINTCLNNKAN